MKPDITELTNALRDVLAPFLEEPFDYEQGLCWWCDTSVTDGRGGHAPSRHKPDCVYIRALAAIGQEPFSAKPLP